MNEAFIDTDVIIRFLTGDDIHKQQAAATLFEKVAKGEITIFAPDTVIADAVFVLSSPRLYHLPHEQITALLSSLLRLTHFQVENKRNVLRALTIYGTTKIDFGDTLLIATMEQKNKTVLYAYDHDYDAFAEIERREP